MSFNFIVKPKEENVIYKATILDDSQVLVEWTEDGEQNSVHYPVEEVNQYLELQIWEKVNVF